MVNDVDYVEDVDDVAVMDALLCMWILTPPPILNQATLIAEETKNPKLFIKRVAALCPREMWLPEGTKVGGENDFRSLINYLGQPSRRENIWWSAR